MSTTLESFLYQCPGCWSYGTFLKPKDGWIECDCGQRMTRVDLRNSETDYFEAVDALGRLVEAGDALNLAGGSRNAQPLDPNNPGPSARARWFEASRNWYTTRNATRAVLARLRGEENR